MCASYCITLERYVCFAGGSEILEQLLKDERLRQQKSAIEGLEEMKLLFRYCELYGALKKVCKRKFLVDL